MKLYLLTTVIAALATADLAIANGNHAGGHEGDYAIGMKGDKAKSKRIITITMSETDDGKMKFTPEKLEFSKGEVVTLNFVNNGKTDHEFVMDTTDNVIAHKAVMEKNPDMEHADDNSLRLAPGAKGQIVWAFAKAGEFTFACLIPGHFESGMHGPIKVSEK